MEQPIECSDGDLLGHVFSYKGVLGEQQPDEVAIRVGAVSHTRELTENGKEETKNSGVVREVSKMVLKSSSKIRRKFVLRDWELVFQELDCFGQDFSIASAVFTEDGLIARKVTTEGSRCVYDNYVGFLATNLRCLFNRKRLPAAIP